MIAPADFMRQQYPELLREVLAERYEHVRATPAWQRLPALELACRWQSGRLLVVEVAPSTAAEIIKFMLGAGWPELCAGFLRQLPVADDDPADGIELEGVDVVGIEVVGCGYPVRFLHDRAAGAAPGSPAETSTTAGNAGDRAIPS